MTLKAVLIDDELNSIDVLKILIAQYCPNVNVIGTAQDASSGSKLINHCEPDLVFLDIEMPSASGFDMLDRISKKNFQTIFITAYDHYALRAIKYYTLDYLLKPVDIDELVSAVHKAEEKMRHEYTYSALDIVKKYINRETTSKIAIPTANGLQFVGIADIVRCEADGNYTRMHVLGNQNYLITRTLKDYEELLASHNFIRIHHAHLINLAHIEKYVKGEGGYVIMTDGSVVDISKRKKQEFLGRFISNP